MTIVPFQGSVPDVEHVTLGERLAAAWLLSYGPNTRTAYGRDLRRFVAWLEDRSVDVLAVERAHVDAYGREMGEVDHLAPATVARRLSAVASFYTYLVDEGAVERNPAARVRRPKVGRESLTVGLDRLELKALIEEAAKDGPRSLAFVLLGSVVGLRVSEILGLDVEHLGSERGHRVARITRKGGRVQLVALPPRVAEAVDDLKDDRTSGPLFVTRTGKRWIRTNADGVLRRLVSVAVPDKAGRVSPHSLRHTFATEAMDNGAAIQDVSAAMGHADVQTTMRYHRTLGNLDRSPAYLVASLV